MDAGCRAALACRGVAHLSCPVDLQEQSLSQDEPSAKKVVNHTSSAWTPPIVVPQAQRPRGCSFASEFWKENGDPGRARGTEGRRRTRAVCRPAGSSDREATPGKSVVPDDSPYTTGGIGLLGTLPSELAMEECDSLLMAGTSFPYLEYYPRSDQARAVQIDSDPTRIGLRFPIDIGLTGDAKATLRALCRKSSAAPTVRSWRKPSPA